MLKHFAKGYKQSAGSSLRDIYYVATEEVYAYVMPGAEFVGEEAIYNDPFCTNLADYQKDKDLILHKFNKEFDAQTIRIINELLREKVKGVEFLEIRLSEDLSKVIWQFKANHILSKSEFRLLGDFLEEERSTGVGKSLEQNPFIQATNESESEVAISLGEDIVWRVFV